MIPNTNLPPPRSSFVRREMSKEDVIIHFLQKQLEGSITSTLEAFNRLVCDMETLTLNGKVIIQNGTQYNLTPEDLKKNLDEFHECEFIAVEGRKFLDGIGYVPQRKIVPPAGVAPIGKVVNLVPATIASPGQEPLQTIGVVPKPQAPPNKFYAEGGDSKPIKPATKKGKK